MGKRRGSPKPLFLPHNSLNEAALALLYGLRRSGGSG